MVSINTLRKLLLLFPVTTEEPHFEKTSFRVSKKIFATVDIDNKRVTLKFSQLDQSVFCSFKKSIIYPVAGTWGKQGWTIVELNEVKKNMLKDALTMSYCNVAPKKLSRLVRPNTKKPTDNKL